MKANEDSEIGPLPAVSGSSQGLTPFSAHLKLRDMRFSVFLARVEWE
jgi:hypothetical protein